MAGRAQKAASLGSFLMELVVYAVFVFAYFFLVLHFLGNWVDRIFNQNRTLYAGVALALIVLQGVALEMLTTALLRVIRRKVE
jgi:membrane protease YdiL (CAAX protease family)